MNRYLDALEVVAFEVRGAECNLVDLSCYDLLIVAMNPHNQHLEVLFNKISESVKLISSSITYQTILLDQNSDTELEQIIDRNKFNNLVVFGEVTAIRPLIEIGQLTSDRILYCTPLEILQNDANHKKQLWSELKTFLSR